MSSLLPSSEGLHGAYPRSQLITELGRYALGVAVEQGLLTPFTREVLVDRRRAAEFRTRAAASLLVAGPQAVLTGHTALVLHGCPAADDAPVHVLLPYYRKMRPRPGISVHYGQFDEQDVQVREGMRVLALDVALAEVLCRGSRRAGLACADQALAMLAEADRAEFRAWTEERIRARPDRRGSLRGLALLDLATGLAESPPESWLLLGLVDAGLPAPEPQVSVLDLDGNEIYRLDLGWREARIAVEYDGYEAHEARRERDAARDDDLRRRGWIVIRADASDLKDPSRVVAAVRAAFHSRRQAA